MFRSSHHRCSVIKAVLHRKTPALESLFNKVAGLKACNFFKGDSNTGVFLWNIRDFSEHIFWRTSVTNCFCFFKTMTRQIPEQWRGSFMKKIRSSHQRCSIKKVVLGNFTKFTGKHLCQSLFFNKVAGLSLRPQWNF